MESEKRGECSRRTLKSANGNSVQFVERDCGITLKLRRRGPSSTVTDSKWFRAISHDPNYVTFRFPAVVYKFPKNIHELDMTERKKVVIQIWLEAVQTLSSYFTIGLNEAEAIAGNPDLVVDQDAIMKILEEMKMGLNVDEDGVKKLCEEIMMKLNLD